MSRRGAKAESLGGEHDVFPTPSWCVDRLFDAVTLPGGQWLEPAAGEGALIRAVNRRRTADPIEWTAVDVRDTRREVGIAGASVSIRGDFLAREPETQWWETRFDRLDGFDVTITNPPYSQAEAFLDRMLDLAPVVVLLLRLNFLESQTRAARFRSKMPSEILVLPNRPSFVAGRTDSCAYAWMVWDQWSGPTGRIRVLGSTPREERQGGAT